MIISSTISSCIYGRITLIGGGGSQVGDGYFYANRRPITVAHEMGHVLGLPHTFGQAFLESDHEAVLPSGICDCNCDLKNDRICETPTDPFKDFIFYTNSTERDEWNIPMFDEVNKIIKNDDEKLDLCGTNFSLISDHHKVMSNIMSYHDNRTSFVTAQIALIKLRNLNKPWVAASSSPISISGETINAPTTISEDRIYTDDLIVNNKLTLNNCNLYFSGGKKLILNSGSSLNLNNSTIQNNIFIGCVSNSGLWQGIKIEGRTNIALKDNSEIKNAAEVLVEANKSGGTLMLNSGSKLSMPSTKNVIRAVFNNGQEGLFYLKTTNGVVSGKIDISNVSGGISAIGTTFIDEVNIFNASLNTASYTNVVPNIGCIFLQNVTLDNINLKSSRITNSTFERALSIPNHMGPLKIVDNNIFNKKFSTIRLGNVPDYDIYNNQFTNCFEGIRIDGSKNTNPNLLLSNIFSNCNIPIKVYSESSKLALECNNISLTTGAGAKDWDIQAQIASNQGDDKLAAGNLFSRFTTEVEYSTNSDVIYWYRNQSTEEPIYIAGSQAAKFDPTRIQGNGSKCDLGYPQITYPTHCFNGIKDGDEKMIDCGGSCKACDVYDTNHEATPAPCNNGIQDNGETGVDCGGICPKCATCDDRIMNGLETGVDCGGPMCPPCFMLPLSPCTDGVMNNGETGIDCGGSCTPCNVNGVFNCFDGVQNGTETGIDCGGACHPCGTDGPAPHQYDHTAFVAELSGIYGATLFPAGSSISISSEINAMNSLMDGGNTTAMVNLINANSSSSVSTVISALQSASPYVSPRAMHALFANSQYFTQAEVANILALNPGTASDRYIHHIIYSSGSFSGTSATSITNAVSTGDVRTQKNLSIDIKRHYMHHLLRQDVDNELSRVVPDYDYIRAQYGKKDDPSRVYQIYYTYIAEDRYMDATAFLASNDAAAISDPYYSNELAKFKEVHKILMKHYYAGNGIVTMPTTTKADLDDIALGCNGEASSLARAVMTQLYENVYTNSPCNLYPALTFASPTIIKSVKETSFALMPNPVTSMLDIVHERSSDDAQSTFEVSIYDIMGKIVYKGTITEPVTKIDVSTWTTGVYSYNIYSDKEQLSAGKFIKID